MMKTKIKALIVRATLWGLIPPAFAEWLIYVGGLRNA